MVQFESGHPDFKSPLLAALNKIEIGALGALDKIQHSNDLGVKRPNQLTTEKMIKDITIKNYNGNAACRWYVSYYEFYPEVNKWKRHREYGGVNREPDAAKRTQLIQKLAYEIQTTFYNRLKIETSADGELYSLIKFYVAEKEASLRKTSLKNIKLALNYFYGFMHAHSLHKIPISQINRQHLFAFRSYLAKNGSGRSANNHIGFVRTFFNYLIDQHDDLLIKNPCTGLTKLPETSETHVAYSDTETKKYFEYMAQTDKNLLLFCKFIGMAFVRCEETRKLKVGDIDFTKRTITVSAGNSKTRTRTVKPLLDAFYNVLMEAEIHLYPHDHYIFTYSGKPGPKPVHYNHFRKKFKKLKTKFKLNSNYTIYGFRHTFVSQLIGNGAKWHEVMKYTGHTTMEAFSKYARCLGAKPAEDLSRFLNIN